MQRWLCTVATACCAAWIMTADRLRAFVLLLQQSLGERGGLSAMGRVATAWDQSLLPQGARRVTGPTSSRGRTPNDATALPPIGSRAGTMEGDERGSRASRWSLLGGARVSAPARRGPDRGARL